jgi:hypothetical protein
MSEWWTYRPSSFLMFSASSHARLLEQFNRDAWPSLPLVLGAGLLLLFAAAAPSSRAARWAPLVLAAVWAWVGWAFLWSRFAEINTAASYLAVAFWIQAAMLAAVQWRALAQPVTPGQPQALALAVVAVAVFLWPLSAALTGRSWLQAEYFGLAPEPTALATLGWLRAAAVPHKRLLAVIPVLSLVLGLGMLWLLYGPIDP